MSNDRDDSSDELLDLAEAAAARGNGYEAAHLYLAAFEASALSDNTLVQPAIDGLYKAWDISHELKDRSLAEHVFERLEPYLSSEEVASHAEALQRLALDKLEEFGLSRKDIQDMAQMVSEDFAGIKDGMVVGQVFARSLPAAPSQSKPSTGVVPWPQESQDQVAKEDDDAREQVDPDEFTYDDLVGFDRAIESMHMRGIGLANDSEFSEFVASLSRRHGIDSLSSFETMLFRSASREDANQFMLATGKELGVPGLRMYMDQTPMGFPILCVVATNDFRINATRGFSGPGMLLLEDVDLWGAPFTNDFYEDDE
ncbi:MAG: hypothetical protein IJ131_09395 [Eggerthellaceae bacterium]|nr:hypothetical protein [Eggerthellaceae bacterium]